MEPKRVLKGFDISPNGVLNAAVSKGYTILKNRKITEITTISLNRGVF